MTYHDARHELRRIGIAQATGDPLRAYYAELIVLKQNLYRHKKLESNPRYRARLVLRHAPVLYSMLQGLHESFRTSFTTCCAEDRSNVWATAR